MNNYMMSEFNKKRNKWKKVDYEKIRLLNEIDMFIFENGENPFKKYSGIDFKNLTLEEIKKIL